VFWPHGRIRGGGIEVGGHIFLKKRSIFEKKKLLFLGKQWDFAPPDFFFHFASL